MDFQVILLFQTNRLQKNLGKRASLTHRQKITIKWSILNVFIDLTWPLTLVQLCSTHICIMCHKNESGRYLHTIHECPHVKYFWSRVALSEVTYSLRTYCISFKWRFCNQGNFFSEKVTAIRSDCYKEITDSEEETSSKLSQWIL